MLFPDVCFVLLYHVVDVVVEDWDLWVSVVCLSYVVSELNEVSYVLWKKFVSVVDFAFGYVMFVCALDDVSKYGVCGVYVVGPESVL